MDFKWFQKLWTSEKSTISRVRIQLVEITTQSHQQLQSVTSTNRWTHRDKWRSWLIGPRVLQLVWDQERTLKSCISVDTEDLTSQNQLLTVSMTVMTTEEVFKLKKHTTCRWLQLVNQINVSSRNRLISHCWFCTHKVTPLHETMDSTHRRQQALPWA